MEKIKGFHISSMTVSGFKCYEAPMEITFGNPTIVTGGNGRGKSSLADAIAFAVTGLPFFGERGIDRLHNETNPDLQITMRFTDDTGRAHELTRSRQKDRMSITYDGYAIRQTDLNEMFGERDVFLSIFNPLYFIEELGEDGKKLLERYLPPVQQADVLSLLNAQTQQRLSGLKLLSPETFLKNRREEIRELEQDAVYLSGKLDLAQKQRQSSKELSSRLTAQIQDLQQEIASLEARRFENVNLEDLQEQLVQASEQYEELSGESPETPDMAELDAKLQEFHAKLGARSSEVYQPKYTGPLAEDTAKVQALGKKYQQNAALLKRFQSGTSCPVCRRVLSQQEYPAFRQALQAETEKIAADGTQLKGQITELQELEQKSQIQPEDVIQVELPIGLPPKHFAELCERYERYFKGDGKVQELCFNDKVYHLCIQNVMAFPQDYAAMMTRMMEIREIPKVVGIDIGGFTSDYLLMRSGRPDMDYCDSLEKGVITMYNDIISSINSEYDMLLEEADIDSIIKGKTQYYEEAVVQAVETMVQNFVTDLLNSIRERGIDTKSTYTVFIGGGAVLLERFLEQADRLGKHTFIRDMKANADGYDLLYRMTQAGV